MFGEIEVVSVTDRVRLRRFVLCLFDLPLYQCRDRRVDPSRGLEKRRDGLGAVDEPVDQKRRGRCGQWTRAFLLRTTCGIFVSVDEPDRRIFVMCGDERRAGKQKCAPCTSK